MLGVELLRPSRRQRDGKILTVDIERRAGLAYAWQPRTDYIPPANWVRWPSLLCFAAKWLGGPMVFHSVWADGEDGLRRAAWDLYDEADVIVTYNGVRFDNKHLRSEWISAGMPAPRPWKDVDLFAEVRRSLGFESKSLDQVCQRLGVPGKSGAYSIRDAEACVDGDSKARARMERYNRADVRATETAYLRMLGWLPAHPAIGPDGDELVCCQCGSAELKPNGWYRAVVLDYALYRCSRCHANIRSSHSRRVARTRNVR